MADPVTDPEKIENWMNTFAINLKQLEGMPEYDEKLALFHLFNQRLQQFGFQLARQIVVIGTKSLS